MQNRVDELIGKVDKFRFWEDKEAFLRFRKEMFALYDKLSEAEQREIDETMVMEQIAMIYSCYEHGD